MSRHPKSVIAAATLVLAACSGGGDEAVEVPTTVTATTTTLDGGDAAELTEPAVSEVDESSTGIVPQWSVTIDVAAEGFDGGPVDASVGWTGDPDDVVDDGPFGSYASCSGLHDGLGAYSVFVSGADEVDAVGIWTASRVVGAGTYDAEVRVERAGSDPMTASGTMTILDDLQHGQFLAFGAAGGRVEGSFSCSGSEPATPLHSDTDVSGAVEVFAVLRSGDAERFVGLATLANGAVTCRPDEGLVLLVDGDASTGAITAIELGTSSPASSHMRVAGTAYEFLEVDIVLEEGPDTSGVFSATTADGVSVDGAFRCS